MQTFDGGCLGLPPSKGWQYHRARRGPASCLLPWTVLQGMASAAQCLITMASLRSPMDTNSPAFGHCFYRIEQTNQ